MHRFLTVSLLATATLVGSTIAMGATLLAPGSSYSISGTNSVFSPDAYGTLVYSQSDTYGNGIYSGTVESRVIQNVSGELVFEFEMSGDSILYGLESVSYSGFAGVDLWADFKSTALSADLYPSEVSRSSDGDDLTWAGPWGGSGNIYHHDTFPMFAATDATAYDATGGVLTITTQIGSFNIIVAAPMVPTPGALALLGLAGGLTGSRRRRR